MKFCGVCENMLYIRLGSSSSAEASLQYACKTCGFTVDANETDSKSCILNTNYVDDQTSYKQFANPFIVHDPTLPRVDNIPCTNPDCTKPADKGNEVIYVKYDFANLRFLYHCTHCGAFWKSGGAAVASHEK